MTQMYAQELFSIPLGRIISVKGVPIRVVGKMREKYRYASGVSEAYILALQGKKEVGIEFGDGEWYAWTSRFSKSYPRNELERIIGTLNDVETGTIRRMESEGDVSPQLPNYVFGRILGKGVFLAFDDTTLEAWVSENIDYQNISIPMKYSEAA
jgi:hypothetical protein